jgi:hypothetical protein
MYPFSLFFYELQKEKDTKRERLCKTNNRTVEDIIRYIFGVKIKMLSLKNENVRLNVDIIYELITSV